MKFEKDFYENVTGMEFPSQFEVLETFDNGEFLTASVLKIDSNDLKRFAEKYDFKKLEKQDSIMFLARLNLKNHPPDFSKDSLLVVVGSNRKNDWKGTNDWMYIIDQSKQTLWAQVTYPDWSGD